MPPRAKRIKEGTGKAQRTCEAQPARDAPCNWDRAEHELSSCIITLNAAHAIQCHLPFEACLCASTTGSASAPCTPAACQGYLPKRKGNTTWRRAPNAKTIMPPGWVLLRSCRGWVDVQTNILFREIKFVLIIALHVLT